jgi:hypothetical protein
MQEEDLKLLWMFTLRIGMYTGKENKDTVAAFLWGYQIGRGYQCNFIERLSESIHTTYKIEKRAMGWIQQIEALSEKLETDWISVFKKHSLDILANQLTEKIKLECTDSLKSRINGKMSGAKNHFRRDWITDWFGIVAIEASWFRELWSEKELELLIKIEQELKHYGKVREIKPTVQPTDTLINLCANLYKEMNKDSIS